MIKRSTKRKAGRVQWESRLFEWKQSGLSQSAFCRQHDLRLRSFQYWKKKLDPPAISEAKLPEIEPVKIVQLSHDHQVTDFLTGSGRYSIKLRVKDIIVELSDHFSSEALARLLTVLKAE